MRLVLFRDLLEEDSDPQYGIVLDDNTILCLCCGGILEQEDYIVLQNIEDINISELLKKELEA